MGFDTTLFVQQPVDPNLICNICLLVQEKPTTVCENGHTFCEDCIQTWESKKDNNSDKCPECRIDLCERKICCRPIKSMTLGMKVCCPANSSDQRSRSTKRSRAGCPWEGPLSSFLEIHKVSECDFTKKACLDCWNYVAVSKMEKHLVEECGERLVACSLCTNNMKAHHLQAHQHQFCPERFIQCPRCMDRVKKRKYGKVQIDPTHPQLKRYTGHLKVCSKVRVPCKFARFGCNTRVCRDQLASHRRIWAEQHAEMALRHTHEEQNWHQVNLSWTIPQAKLSVLRAGKPLRSAKYPVGDFDVYLQALEVCYTVSSGTRKLVQIRICVAANEASRSNPRPIRMDRLSITFNGNFHNQMLEVPLSKSIDRTVGVVSRLLKGGRHNDFLTVQQMSLSNKFYDGEHTHDGELNVSFRLHHPSVAIGCEV